MQTYIREDQIKYHEEQLKKENRRTQRLLRAKAAFTKYFESDSLTVEQKSEQLSRITEEYMAEWLLGYDEYYRYSDSHSVWQRGEEMSRKIDILSKVEGVPKTAIEKWRSNDKWIEETRASFLPDLKYSKLYNLYAAGVTDLHVKQAKDYIDAIAKIQIYADKLKRHNRVWTKRTPRNFLLDNGETIPCYASALPPELVPALSFILRNTQRLINSKLCKGAYFMDFIIPDKNSEEGFLVVNTNATYCMDKWDNQTMRIGNVSFIVVPDNKHFECNKFKQKSN